MNPHRVSAAVLIPLAAALHAFGYYSARSMAWRHGIDNLQLDSSTIGTAMSVATTAGVFGLLAAVVLGALAGAPLTAAAGLLVAAAGVVVQSVASSSWGYGLGIATAGFGAGMYRPAMIASALRPFGSAGPAARIALLLSVYAGTNFAALSSGFVGSAIQGMGSAATSMAMVAGAMCSGTAALLFLVLAGAGFVGGPQEHGSYSGRTLGASAVAVVIGGPAYAAWTLGGELQWRALGEMFGSSNTLFYVNPAVNVAACVAFAAGFGGVHFSGVRPPALAVAGVGFVCAGVGLVPSAAAQLGGLPLAVACVVIGAVGEGLLWAGLMSAVVGALHWRLAIIPPAMVTAASTGTNMFSGLLGYYPGSSAGWGATLLAIAVFVGGIVLLAAAWPLRKWLDDDDPGVDPGPTETVDPYGFRELSSSNRDKSGD